MKRFNKMIGIALSLIMATLISGCGGGGDTVATNPTGKLSLSITDAPLKLEDNVTEVNIAVIGIEYNHEGSWTAADDFGEPQTFNLLDLQNGKALHLGDMVLPVGHYNDGIRFILAAPQNDGDIKSNPDCNIVFADGTSVPLFVPSGAQSGYKGKGAFDITADAKIEVTADFDVHKSIVVTGKDKNVKYILKPVIRLVVTELSGDINGTVVDVADYNSSESLVVYTYEQDTYADTEAEGEIIFANSISSGDVNMTDGNFMLSFLGEGSYSLVTALYIDNVFDTVVDVKDNVVVFTGESTSVDINTSYN